MPSIRPDVVWIGLLIALLSGPAEAGYRWVYLYCIDKQKPNPIPLGRIREDGVTCGYVNEKPDSVCTWKNVYLGDLPSGKGSANGLNPRVVENLLKLANETCHRCQQTTQDTLQQSGLAKCDCDNAKEKLDALIGRLRGLRAASEAHRRALQQADNKRDSARDSIYGAQGTAASTLSSFISALPGQGQVAKYAPVALTTIDVVFNGNYEALAKAIADWWTDKALAEVSRGVIQRAAKSAHQNYQQYGSGVWARQHYANQVRGAKWIKGSQEGMKQVGRILALKELHEQGNRLADDIQAYLDNARDAKMAQKEIDKIDKQVDDINQDILKLRACLGQKPGAGLSGITGEKLDFRPADHRPTADSWWIRSAHAATASRELDIKRLQAAHSQLRLMLKRLDRFFERELEELLIPLTSFATGDWRTMQPAVQGALVASTQEPIRQLQATLNEIDRSGNRVVRELKAARGESR